MTIKREEVQDFVAEVMEAVPRPLTEHVTCHVFWLIERCSNWRAQYDRFAAAGDFDTMNREIGRAVKEKLDATNIEERPAHGSCVLIKTYTMLRFAED